MGMRGKGSIARPPRRPNAEALQRPPFRQEVLALFCELEALRDGGVRRDDHKFRERSYELARMLGLEAAWWTVDDVHDRGGPPNAPVARENWKRCRAVRFDLLRAVEELNDEKGVANTDTLGGNRLENSEAIPEPNTGQEA
jgi:hypothetical protein